MYLPVRILTWVKKVKKLITRNIFDYLYLDYKIARYICVLKIFSLAKILLLAL